MQIKLLNRNEIDDKKWNDSIKKSKNSFVYALSWYIDITTQKKWKALIIGDYEYVMPLPEKQKYFLKYIFQPFFSQQLGIFSKNDISENIINLFLKEISEKYRFINTNLNFANNTKQYNFNEKTNFELNLNKPYEELKKKYSKNTKTYLKKTQKDKLIFSTTENIDDIVQLKRTKETINLSSENLDLLLKLLKKITRKLSYKIYAVKNDNNELISAFFFVLFKNKAYYIFSEANNEGRKKFASFYLMDKFIKDHAEQDIIIDFEGSMIPGVARFFTGWGAKNNPYYNFKLNRLPLFLKFFRK